MERRTISIDVYNKVINRLPNKIIKMLPDEPLKLLKYATRIVEVKFSPNIDENTKKMMKEFLLTDEEYLITFYYVMAISFYNKRKVENPKLSIVAAQTGSGKSNLTAKILREDDNYVFIDSDKYKHYRYDANKISEEYPLLYPFLTGPDGYDHADNIYSYAIDNKYNIIKETAPSHNKGLIDADIKRLKDNNYTIDVSILAVSNLNSCLSMHERYELQILSGLKTAKLTGLNRHNESYNSLITNVEDLISNYQLNKIEVFKRGEESQDFAPIRIYPNDEINSPIEAINNERIEDLENTKKELEERYNLIVSQMNNRKAPKEQVEQLYNIKENIEK